MKLGIGNIGGPASDMWEPQGDGSGVTDPEGHFHPFGDGEEFAGLKSDHFEGRAPVIRRPDGTMLTFEAWEATKDVDRDAIRIGGVSYGNLWQPTGGVDGKASGVTMPTGDWVGFQNGEEFVLIREEDVSDRIPAVRLADGKVVPFSRWRILESIRRASN
jgi:hypothetical protein